MKSAIFTDDSFGYSAIEEAIEYFSVAYKYDITAIVSTVDLAWKEIRGIPVYTAGTLSECLDKAAAKNRFATVLDVTSYSFADKFTFANVIINKGYALYGADYRIFPPQRKTLTSPGIVTVLGNCNFGKTAAVAYIKKAGTEYGSIASVSSDPRAPRYSIIVEPDKIRNGHDYSGLLAEHRMGRVINLYHYAVALTAGIRACSSTFAGIGFSGVPYASLDVDGILYAAGYEPDLMVLLSDKSVIPRVSSDRAILIIEGSTDPAELEMYPYLYKLGNADLIILLSPLGAGGTRTGKLLSKIQELCPSSNTFKAIENPVFLNEPEVGNGFMVYSERKEIVSATRTYLEKKYSIKIRENFDGSTPIPNQTELKKKAKKGKSCFILDLFDENFAEWLEALVKAGIPVSVLSRELTPSPKKAFDNALSSLLDKAYAAGQKRLAAAKVKEEEMLLIEEADEAPDENGTIEPAENDDNDKGEDVSG